MILCLFAVIPSLSSAFDDEITLLIPPFNGPKPLGIHVTTILYLNVFKTLRRAPTPNPENLSFGRGMIRWTTIKLSKQRHLEAEVMAEDWRFFAQLVLWGKAWEYGDGIVVQSYLSLPKYDDGRDRNLEIWKTRISVGEETFFFEADIPRRRIDFRPISLTKAFVHEYSSPVAMKIYSTVDLRNPIGRTGLKLKAVEVRGNIVKVRSGEKVGWLQIPSISGKPSELTDFVGAMIRIYRGDWQGAFELFDNVTKSSTASASLKLDAFLLKARAKEELGENGDAELEAAFKIDPYSRMVIAYRTMKWISDLKEAIIQSQESLIRQDVLRIEGLLSKKKYLFHKGDPFLSKTYRFIETVRRYYLH